MIAQTALSPLTPLSQPWERGELDSPPPILGAGGGGHDARLFVIGQQVYCFFPRTAPDPVMCERADWYTAHDRVMYECAGPIHDARPGDVQARAPNTQYPTRWYTSAHGQYTMPDLVVYEREWRPENKDPLGFICTAPAQV